MESPLKRVRLVSPHSLPSHSVQTGMAITPRLGNLSSALTFAAPSTGTGEGEWDGVSVVDLSAERGRAFELLVVVSFSLPLRSAPAANEWGTMADGRACAGLWWWTARNEFVGLFTKTLRCQLVRRLHSSRRYTPPLLHLLCLLSHPQPLPRKIDESDIPLFFLRKGGSGLGAISNLVEKAPRTFEGWVGGAGKARGERGVGGKGDGEIERLVKREGGGRIAGKVWESIKYVAHLPTAPSNREAQRRGRELTNCVEQNRPPNARPSRPRPRPNNLLRRLSHAESSLRNLLDAQKCANDF